MFIIANESCQVSPPQRRAVLFLCNLYEKFECFLANQLHAVRQVLTCRSQRCLVILHLYSSSFHGEDKKRLGGHSCLFSSCHFQQRILPQKSSNQAQWPQLKYLPLFPSPFSIPLSLRVHLIHLLFKQCFLVFWRTITRSMDNFLSLSSIFLQMSVPLFYQRALMSFLCGYALPILLQFGLSSPLVLP